MVKPYLRDIINDHKAHEKLKVHSGNKITDYETTLGEWKIQLKMSINFISSKDDPNKISIMRTKSENIDTMKGSETNEIIEELFESLLQNHQKDLEESMRGNKFNFSSVDLLYHYLQKNKSEHKGRVINRFSQIVEK